MSLPPPSPIRILRLHNSQISAIHLSPVDPESLCNERLYTGDIDGFVVVTSTRSFRALATWQAHGKGILGIEEWGTHFITHGRDNKLHVWDRPLAPATVTDTATPEDATTPIRRYSLDVNALNFCRFSLLPSTTTNSAWIAVPNLVESSLVDIWEIPSLQRIHAAVGKTPGTIVQDPWDTTGRGPKQSGSIMSTHLFTVPHPSQSTTSQLRVLTAYENGGLCLWAHTDAEKKVSVEGIGWQALWQVKVHAESIMAMAVSPLKDFAITVSADNLVVRCNLNDEPVVQHEIPHDGVSGRLTVHRTKHPGNGFVAIQHGGRVCAVAGWDGKIRLYSTKSFKSLGTLSYHKGGCQCVTFASPDSAAPHPGDPDDDIDAEDREKHARWLVSGATDKRVVVWELMDFDRAKS